MHTVIRVICILIFILAILTTIPPQVFHSIYNYQALIAGIIAFIGALLTVLQMQQQENDRTYRNSISSRSSLAIAAVKITEYLHESIDYTYKKRDKTPVFPQSELNVISEHIKYTDKKSAEEFHRILSFAQIHHSRLSKQDDSRIAKSSYSINQNALDSLILGTCLNDIFYYARNHNRKFHLKKITRERLHKSLKNIVGLLDYDQDPYVKIYDHIENMKEYSISSLNNQIDFAKEPF